MTNKYTKNLTDILEMLWNIERDLNLIKYNETEKKFTILLLGKYPLVAHVIYLMLSKNQVFQDQQYIKQSRNLKSQILLL